MLQAFASAAKTGNFARAAADLNLTASAISHQIGKLEEWWGLKLFDRNSRGVTLTAAGARLFPVAETFFREMERELQALAVSARTPLRVACTSSLCAAWLGPRLLHGSNLDVLPEIVLQSAEVDRSNPTTDSFDVAVVIGDGAYPGYRVEFLMRDMVFPVCAPGLLKQGEFDLDTLHLNTIIRRVEDPPCPGWQDWCDFHKVPAGPYQEGPCFPDTGHTIGLAARGGGIALGRTALVHDYLQQGALVPASRHRMPSPAAYYVICKEGRERDADIDRFVDWVRTEANLFLQQMQDRFPSLVCSRREVLPAAALG